MPHRTVLISGLLLGLLASTPARGAAPPDDEIVYKLRVMSFSQWSLPLKGEAWGVTLAGGSLAVEFPFLLALEVGGGWLFSDLLSTFDLYLRAGIAHTLLDDRDAVRSGWVVQFNALGGYRFLQLGGSSDGNDARENNHCLHALAGLDVTYWGSGDVGFTARLGAGLIVPVSRSADAGWSDSYISQRPSRLLADVQQSIGIAFR